MSIRELRWCIGRYTTFSENDVFEGLGNAILEAKDKDAGTPPADFTASTATTDTEDIQLSHMETQLVDDTITLLPGYKPEAKDEDTGTPPVDFAALPAMTNAKDSQPSPLETPPAAKHNTRIQKDLLATQGGSPVKLEDPVTPTTILVDKLAGPPTLASHTAKERQEHLQWVKIHSSQKAAAVGSAPYKHGEHQWHCHHSSMWCKGTQCLLEEEQQDLGDVFMSTSSKGSPELAPCNEGDKGADLKGCPQGSGR